MNNAPSNQPTILWHDYETFGVNPARDRPSQFAAIRTDLDLNIISEPISFYCQLATDYLPSPEAIMITGITPQLANQKGCPEAEFMGKINELFMQPNTCVAGYNSLRFDDEVSRHGFYRNFFDPYAREWQQGNSRWDIIDLVRACYALRPDGIIWPTAEDTEEKRPSFKLENLTHANNISHQQAHDAMSDVYATIDMARLIKQKQPRLFDFYFQLRDKNVVGKMINVLDMRPLVHVSSKINAANGCATLIAPVAHHGRNKNAIICVNLAMDISPLIDLNIEQLRERLYTRHSELGEDELPVGVKQLHLNKCPFIAPLKSLTDKNAARLNIDKAFAKSQYQRLRQNPQLREKLVSLFDSHPHQETNDPDLQLYSGGFFGRADKEKMQIIRHTTPHNLAALDLTFDDQRLQEMLFRYRGRNYPQTLVDSEQQRWRDFCQARLDNPDYMRHLQSLLNNTEDAAQQKLLTALCNYLSSL